jgi:5-methylcytosine-specific restriction endonuclease McrA
MFTNEFREKVLSQYVNGKSQMQLQKEFGVSKPTILKWIKAAGIQEHYFKAKYLDKDIVLKLYDQGWSVLKIAEELNIGRRPLESILKQNNIFKRDNSQALLQGRYGKDGNLTKGRPRELLQKEFPGLEHALQMWKAAILTLDNFTCQLCGKTSESLEAHHIIPLYKIYRENLKRFLLVDLKNGVAVCNKPCHKNIAMNEQKFEQQFKELVNNRVNSVDISVQKKLKSLLR